MLGDSITDPVKIAAIRDWPTPDKVKDVHSFLGFCNFYRAFIKGFTFIAKPLNVSRPLPWWVLHGQGYVHIRIGLLPLVVPGDYLTSPSHSMPPLLFAHAYPMSNDHGVVLVRFTCLVIMCVGARLHGTLYPMTGCVLYLDGLLC